METLIKLYQALGLFKHTVLVSVFGYTSYCHHQPSCAEYTRTQIKKDGTIRGLFQGVRRLLTCW